jgi:biotin-(acetyl-CoA carboxylase) ligase
MENLMDDDQIGAAVGQARGVDTSGALLVHTADGLKKISSAEVSVRALAPLA